jgi:hypothetical protein
MDIHRKGLRRLHDLCGRVQRAPSAFEVIDTFQPRTPDPQHYTALSDVYRTTDGTRTVALKRLRASQNEASALRKVSCYERATFDARRSHLHTARNSQRKPSFGSCFGTRTSSRFSGCFGQKSPPILCSSSASTWRMEL